MSDLISVTTDLNSSSVVSLLPFAMGEEGHVTLRSIYDTFWLYAKDGRRPMYFVMHQKARYYRFNHRKSIGVLTELHLRSLLYL